MINEFRNNLFLIRSGLLKLNKTFIFYIKKILMKIMLKKIIIIFLYELRK